MNDDLTHLASAYLDGDVTAVERARVESDPEALAEVDRLRSIRLLVGDVEPPPISIREEHLAAALAAWDRVPIGQRTGATRDSTPLGIDGASAAAAATVTAPTRLSARRRHGSTRWLTGAAAALVLVLAGGVALQLGGSSDDDSASDDGGDAAAEIATGATRSAPEEDADSAADDELLTAEADAESLADEPTVGDGSLDTGADTPAPPAETDLVVLLTRDDLAAFASSALDAPSEPDVPAATSAGTRDDTDETSEGSPFPRCLGVDVLVGPARYGDVVVVVGVDESRGLAFAYTVPSCNEIARASVED